MFYWQAAGDPFCDPCLPSNGTKTAPLTPLAHLVPPELRTDRLWLNIRAIRPIRGFLPPAAVPESIVVEIAASNPSVSFRVFPWQDLGTEIPPRKDADETWKGERATLVYRWRSGVLRRSSGAARRDDPGQFTRESHAEDPRRAAAKDIGRHVRRSQWPGARRASRACKPARTPSP